MELFRVEVREIANVLSGWTVEELHIFVQDPTCEEELADIIQDPTCDTEIELFIYICYFIYTRTMSMKYLEQAIQRTEGWAAAVAIDHSDRPRRFQMLDMMSARKFR
jgi:hypothetical protein